MSDIKKNQPEVITLSSEITYQPCKLCKSLAYDMADGNVDDDGNYIPETCDQCFYCVEGLPSGTVCH